MAYGNVIINTSAKSRAYTNIHNERVSSLYEYFRMRIGSPRFPISDRQRFAFDKIIINMCHRGELCVPRWVLNSPKISFYTLSRWLEYRDDVIEDVTGYEIPYKDIREEMCLINRILSSENMKATYIMHGNDADVYMRIFEAHERMARNLSEHTAESLSEVMEMRVDA